MIIIFCFFGHKVSYLPHLLFWFEQDDLYFWLSLFERLIITIALCIIVIEECASSIKSISCDSTWSTIQDPSFKFPLICQLFHSSEIIEAHQLSLNYSFPLFPLHYSFPQLLLLDIALCYLNCFSMFECSVFNFL